MEELLVCVSEGIFSVEEVCQAVNILSGFYEVKIEDTPSYFSCIFFHLPKVHYFISFYGLKPQITLSVRTSVSVRSI